MRNHFHNPAPLTPRLERLALATLDAAFAAIGALCVVALVGCICIAVQA